MRRHPLQESHPQFSVLEFPDYCEYRVENWRLSRDDRNEIIRGTSSFTLRDATLFTLSFFVWWNTTWMLVGAAAIFLSYIWTKCSQVLHESIIILPPHGIQLETHRGFPGLCFFITRRFIRLQVLQDVVIHEGLRGWDVRYYLAAIKLAHLGTFTPEIAYHNLLPQHNVLLYVYRGIHDQLLRPAYCTGTRET
ncbi:hypothetical protein FPV67DRAFT_29044 [Lyophyllum atratum]|nr:hypothetical protein FPV67DRAFT_29044 [Lyophyllum atratum]